MSTLGHWENVTLDGERLPEGRGIEIAFDYPAERPHLAVPQRYVRWPKRMVAYLTEMRSGRWVRLCEVHRGVISADDGLRSIRFNAATGEGKLTDRLPARGLITPRPR